MLTSDPTILQIAYLPGGSFVLPILGRIQRSTNPLVRALAEKWSPTGLADLACSLSTKVAMLDLLAESVNGAAGPLFDEIARDPRAAAALTERKTWPPRSRNQPYRILLALDSFIFELRSTHEILGKFLVTFAAEILGRKVDEATIVAELEARGIDTAWAAELRSHRKIFFHQQAAWVAVRIVSWDPFTPELLMLTHAGADPGDPSEVVTVDQLRAMHQGMAGAIARLQDWLLEEVAALEARRGSEHPA